MKDIYLQFSGPELKGESADKAHVGWIELDSWSHEIVQPRSASASTAGGHTSERCEHGDMCFTKDIDMVSPLMYQHASGGTTFKEATIQFMRADGDEKPVNYLEIKLQNVIISRIQPSADGDGLPREKFALKYAAVQWKYTQQKVTGGEGGNVQAAWSLTKNQKSYTV
jgi:type VI secretion system secreted protein Hcp